MRTGLVLDALRMALGTREHGADFALVAHTDASSQGRFNRSSQRSVERSCDGGRTVSCLGACWASADAFDRVEDVLIERIQSAASLAELCWEVRARPRSLGLRLTHC